MNIESYMKSIEGREYACVEYNGESAAVQDFIRQPHVVPIELEPDLPASFVGNLQKNSRRPTADAMTQGRYSEVWITGDPAWPILTEDYQTAIGVGKAFVSDLVSHSIATDLSGLTLSTIARAPRNLPIGLFEVASSIHVVDFWASRGKVGMYRRHVQGQHAIKRLSSGVTTELYAADPAATAVQYAISHLKAEKILMASCDPTFEEKREGSVPFMGRYIYPTDFYRLAMLHAVCLIAIRNHIEVSWCRDTMAPVPEATAVDRSLNEVCP